MRRYRALVCIGFALWVTSPAQGQRVDFVKDIQPLFRDACYSCHGPKSQMAQSAARFESTRFSRRNFGEHPHPRKRFGKHSRPAYLRRRRQGADALARTAVYAGSDATGSPVDRRRSELAR